ncbi:CoA-substrate-specific enzyme activase, putative [Methanococcoides vulcani]|uniref:CoA-substrate-specific enzyme activase, putative n=1 Tax=Methanococcoides vulcani TaxID=1353158 RepID=A0A1I0A106_9EURY|nr:acyl-CoA dehydratase activase [Methanococcoides vulcani]SES87362.1 CoA-substrate-specific enzyme activase, putative [Methanococcoides vulcani]
MIKSKYSIGIDIGFSSIKIAVIDDSDNLVHTDYLIHKGKIRECLKNMCSSLLENYDAANFITGAVTGSEGKILGVNHCLTHVNNVAALIEGSTTLDENVQSVIEIGGQTARYITGFGNKDRSSIEISTNSNCSAGTGSFLEERVSRLNMSIEDYSACAARSKDIPRIAGRCSVFAKTDIIHHQQEGVPVESILQGLAYALVRNYKGAVIKKLPIKKPILFAGGVAYNEAIVHAMKDVLKLNENELIVPEKCGNIASIGAAVIAKEQGFEINILKILEKLEAQEEPITVTEQDIELPALGSFGDGDIDGKHICKPIMNEDGQKASCYLGIDIGSTSTNLVLINENSDIIAYRYLRTRGDPARTVIAGLADLGQEFGDSVTIAGAGTTGSGRYMIARMIGADVVKDEITAQAKAASTIDNSVDTVFEIGGQDSKYISINDERVTDFQMNKVCAAGTGSFVEEQANKFDIPIDSLGDIALKGSNPANLGERCTVFIETSIATHLANGVKMEDISSGLCYSIVKNYLNRVVGQKKIGDRIFLQGGIAYNQGIINAFRALTGKEIIVPTFFSVTGAYGAAVLSKEEVGQKGSAFKGFDIDETFIPPAKSNKQESKRGPRSEFKKRMSKFSFAGHDGAMDENKKTIGVPRALFNYGGMFPRYNAFFKELGFNILLSSPTTENTIRLGQEYAMEETCYPVKLINGHVAELVNKNVDYVFFPSLYTSGHSRSHSRRSFGCPYMQLASRLVEQAMELDTKGIGLLSPTIGYSLGDEFMENSFMSLGLQLGKSPEEISIARQKAYKKSEKMREARRKERNKIINELRDDEKAIVLVSKIYGVVDPVLNLGIPERLEEMGYKVLSFNNLPESDISKEHPNMFWPFGMHILEAAKIVREHHNIHAILLTHHGCGPDTVFSHYFRELMEGKPFLNIEVDEHSSDVGVITRLEAFINSLDTKTATSEDHKTSSFVSHGQIETDFSFVPEDAEVYIPNIYPYSQLFCEFMKRVGRNTKVIPETSIRSIDEGRKHTVTNEYFSMAALTGDILCIPGIRDMETEQKFLFIPQSEGAELDGQFNRFVRTILDEEGLTNIGIISPYVEDLVYHEPEYLDEVFLILLAGDIIKAAPSGLGENYLIDVLEMIRSNSLNIGSLKTISKDISSKFKPEHFKKTIFAVGEPMILFNDALNNNVLKNIESRGYHVMYAPFSEYMWLLWKDHIDQCAIDNKDSMLLKLDLLQDYISELNLCLSGCSPFDDKLDGLVERADNSLGYYAGAFGRYRKAKILGELKGVHGVVTVASMYENTGILLNALHNGIEIEKRRPILNLMFDGNVSENDDTRIETFLHYL